MAAEVETLRNWIAGEWTPARGTEAAEVTNPASGGVVAEAPMASDEDVADAVQAAHDAFDGWRATPAVERGRLLFRLHHLVEAQFEDLSRIITIENGKTLEEARGELIRTLENIEVAAGIPTLQMGDFSADIAAGIDETSIREPMGVFVQIGPFNFPSMVPFWFAPYALATGNTYVIKPSPQTPISQARMMALIAEAGFPAGVINLVHGGAETAEALIADPRVQGVSFVGTTRVARRIYELAAQHGKRVQAQGGAKNHLVVLPDANLDAAIPNLMGSTFGCAGQRCLAGSVVVAAKRRVLRIQRPADGRPRRRCAWATGWTRTLGWVLSFRRTRAIESWIRSTMPRQQALGWWLTAVERPPRACPMATGWGRQSSTKLRRTCEFRRKRSSVLWSACSVWARCNRPWT